jgi:predicted GIY-YIG superfamily endonuclease
MNPAPPSCQHEQIGVAPNNRQPTQSGWYYVCVLRSLKNGLWYIGCTSNLKSRLANHSERTVFATKGKGPWELIYCEAYRERKNAYLRERALKQFGGAYRQLKRRLVTASVVGNTPSWPDVEGGAG